MYTNQALAVFGAIISLASAVPLNHRREVVWVTKTQETVVTIPVIRTIWLKPGESAPTATGLPSEQTGASTAAASTHYVAPAPASIHTAAVPSSAPATSVAPTSLAAPSVSVAEAPSITEPAAPPPTTISAAAVPATSAPSSPSAPAPSVSAPAPAPTSPTTPTSGATDAGHVDDLADGPAAAGHSYVGDVTWYSTGLGACGQESSAADHIVAVAESVFDFYNVGANPNANPICNQWVEITGVDGTVYPAQVVDRCTGCSAGSLDLSQDFFNLVTNNGDGRVHNIHWQFAGST